MTALDPAMTWLTVTLEIFDPDLDGLQPYEDSEPVSTIRATVRVAMYRTQHLLELVIQVISALNVYGSIPDELQEEVCSQRAINGARITTIQFPRPPFTGREQFVPRFDTFQQVRNLGRNLSNIIVLINITLRRIDASRRVDY